MSASECGDFSQKPCQGLDLDNPEKHSDNFAPEMRIT
jgi:hypothetical protein